MTATYAEVLDATIQELERLQKLGVRYVPVSPTTTQLIITLPRAGDAVARGRSGSTGVSPASAKPAPTSPSVQGKSVPSAAEMPSVAPAPAPAPPAVVVAKSGEKIGAYESLRRQMLECTKCSNLAAARKNVVPGVGSLDAEIMFVGEAPGADEDLQGEPFVGKAGQLLTKIIQAMGLSRETVYIANVLKCRPDTPGQTAGNRKPTPLEMEACIHFLEQQIDLVRPKVLVALGATAVEGLLRQPVAITKIRGQWREYRGIPLMPTYHPSYVLRTNSNAVKREVWEDILQAMEKAGMPISEKQRAFFSKG